MFHVPHPHRIRSGPLASEDRAGNNGAFCFPGLLPGRELWAIASDGLDWEHVSLHAANRTNKLFVPNWQEMCYIKALFWDAEDTVIQIHPPQSTYINMHPATLHLWRPIGQEIPLPHPLLVGYKNLKVAQSTTYGLVLVADVEGTHGS
ncbi:MAG TPA: hypothetical protein VF077_12410 [Nitrospiraceae bacterium]